MQEYYLCNRCGFLAKTPKDFVREWASWWCRWCLEDIAQACFSCGRKRICALYEGKYYCYVCWINEKYLNQNEERR